MSCRPAHLVALFTELFYMRQVAVSAVVDYWEWNCGGSMFKRADFREYVKHSGDTILYGLFACTFIHSIIDVLTHPHQGNGWLSQDKVCSFIYPQFHCIVKFDHCNYLSFENCLTKSTLDSIQVNRIIANLLNLQKAAEFAKMKHVGIVRRSRVFDYWACNHCFRYSVIPSSYD